MRDPMTITIPGTFDRRLTTNRRNNTYWRTVKKVADDLKRRTGAALLLEGGNPNDPENCFQTSPWPLTFDWTVYHEKGQKRYDDDNVAPAMKPARDMIASFLGMDDRNFRTGTITQVNWGTHKGEARIVVTITPAGYWTRVPTAWLEAEGLTPPEQDAA